MGQDITYLMRNRYQKLNILCLLFSLPSWGWGEYGHHLIAKTAAKLVGSHPLVADAKAHPDAKTVAGIFESKRLMLAYLTNVPDTYWRNYERDLAEDVNLLGDSSHFLDTDTILKFESALGFAISKIPLEYDKAKAIVKKDKPTVDFFAKVGSLPWRAQQLTDLYGWRLKNYPKTKCPNPKFGAPVTREALTYAGLLSHFTGDASMPLHAAEDSDGIAAGHKGVHWYFESDLVDSLEPALEAKVLRRAGDLLAPLEVKDPHSVAALRAKARDVYPESEKTNEIAALMLVLLADSFSEVETLLKLDKTYAFEPKCAEGKVCRRAADALVDEEGKTAKSRGDDVKTVAEWHEPLIVERLAMAAALTADIWARWWLKNGEPKLCYGWDFAHKPTFVSPTDKACFGYALAEDPKALKRKNGKSALPWKRAAKKVEDCLKY